MLNISTPLLLLGGKENGLSIARHLGRLGVAIRASGNPSCWAMYSRYCTQAFPVPRKEKQQRFWKTLLLGDGHALDGHIILALSDDAIEFVNGNRSALEQRYKLDDADPELQRGFLDKMRTLDMAHGAGVDAPQHWQVRDEADLAELQGKVRFPVAVKPVQSHKFIAKFRQKLFIVEDGYDNLGSKVRQAWENGIDVFVVEMIPGPDSTLSSYYTYRTQGGGHLFDFTKSVIRRWPMNRGNACYHKTGWLPETAAAGARFFDGVGLKGLGNIEFKRDARDGKLKVIEVNARFTAAQELVRRAGVPIDLMVYCHLTGQPVPEARQIEKELRLWYPLRDFLAFLDLRRRGELSLLGWIKSVATTSQVFPLMSLNDPSPMLGAGLAILKRLTA